MWLESLVAWDFSDEVLHWLLQGKQSLSDPEDLLIILAGTGMFIWIAIGTVPLRSGFDFVFAESANLRRLMLGREFVEGIWLDRMTLNGELVQIGWTRIFAKGLISEF